LSFLLLYDFTAVIAESYERIHRSNLVGMGIIPLQFVDGQSAETLGLTGHEAYTIDIPSDLKPGQIIKVEVRFPFSCRMNFCCTKMDFIILSQLNDGRHFDTRLRFDTDVELTYFRHGGILNYMVRKMAE